ncbi:MAG TPA: hypothetical protein DCQ90_01175 [Erysipelotrichaceae bacterium]|nr:hypothetical protein [Erysipelotrichaceae bacterium]
MRLDEINEWIDATIISRGKSYFREGRVLSVNEKVSNQFQCLVEGTRDYVVEVTLDEDQEIEYSACTCPYDQGEFCKHEVAAFLAIDEYLSKKDKQELDQDCGSTHRNLDDIFRSMSKDEVVSLLREIVKNDGKLKRRIMVKFGDLRDEDLLRQTSKMVRESLEEFVDTYGYTTDDSDEIYCDGVDEALSKAHEYLDEGRVMLSIKILLEIYREMNRMISFYGMFNDRVLSSKYLETSEDLKVCFSHPKLSDGERDNVYDLILQWIEKFIQNREYQSAIHFIELAIEVMRHPYQKEVMDELVEYFICELQEEELEFLYLEKLRFCQYRYIKKITGENSAERFMYTQLDLPIFRELAIQQAMSISDYESAIALCIGGERISKENSLNDVRWKKMRVEIYEKINDLPRFHDLAIELILRGNEVYYDKLKTKYEDEQWRKVYPKLIAKIESENRYGSWVFLNLLIKEQEKEKIINFLRQNPRFAPDVYRHVLPEFNHEMISIFEAYIKEQVKISSTRDLYIKCCDLIRTMVSIGGKNEGKEMILWIRENFRRRSALLEEISKIEIFL